MVKAVVDRGVIRPLEPLPEDWKDGQMVRIELTENQDMSAEEIQRDFALLESLCAMNDPADEERLESALLEADRLAKDQMRREMGV